MLSLKMLHKIDGMGWGVENRNSRRGKELSTKSRFPCSQEKSSGRQHTRESMEIQVKREVSEELEE